MKFFGVHLMALGNAFGVADRRVVHNQIESDEVIHSL